MDKNERQIRNGALEEADKNRKNRRSGIVIIDKKTKEKFFSLVTKGGQVFKKNPGVHRTYEIV